jgi:glycosyltransferase involved in cell wall biosynthesis
MNKFSGLVISYNGEQEIEACLNSLFKICEDVVVVVNSASNDQTVFIAENLGAKVVIQDYLGDGPQRSFGLQYCQHDWIINLDQDERLDDDLVAVISELDFKDQQIEAYECRRKNYLHGKWIKVAGWYPDYICRIFNKNKTDFSAAKIHARIETSRIKRLEGHIIHYSFKDIRDMINRLNDYSSRQAEVFYDQGRIVSSITPVLRGLGSFIKHYLLKRGILAGLDGLTISTLNALGAYFKYAKLIELHEQDDK